MDKFFEIEGIMFKDGSDNGSQPAPSVDLPYALTITVDSDNVLVVNIEDFRKVPDGSELVVYSNSKNATTNDNFIDLGYKNCGVFVGSRNGNVCTLTSNFEYTSPDIYPGAMNTIKIYLDTGTFDLT